MNTNGWIQIAAVVGCNETARLISASNEVVDFVNNEGQSVCRKRDRALFPQGGRELTYSRDEVFQ